MLISKKTTRKNHWIDSWEKEAFKCNRCEKRFNPIVLNKQCSSITPRVWWHREKICTSHHTSFKITLNRFMRKEAFKCKRCEKRFKPIVWNKQCSSITPRGWWHGEKICISHHTSVKITLKKHIESVHEGKKPLNVNDVRKDLTP